MTKLTSSLLTSLLLTLQTGSLSAIDFTLTRRAGQTDHNAVEQTFFTDGNSKIFLKLPPDWTAASRPESLDLTTEIPQSAVRLEQIHGVKSLALDEPSRPVLRRYLTSISSATDLKTEAETLDVLPIFDWKTLEILQSYQLAGQGFKRSVLFLNISADRVLELTVYAPQKDFEKVHAEAIRMMSSWFEPSRDLPPDLAQKYEEQMNKVD